MSDEHVVDGTTVEAPAVEDADIVDQPGTAVAVVEPNAGAIIRAEKPAEVIEKATEIANALKSLIEAQNLSKNLGGSRKHVEVGGWQALGAMLGALGGQPLHAETVWTRKVLDVDGASTGNEHGSDWEACVEIRTPGGVIVGRAEAMCSRTENTWARRDDYAVRSMAETRAESRAFRRAVGWIVNIAGYNPTPAEEMGHAEGAAAGPAFGPAASNDQAAQAQRAVAYLLEVPETHPAVGHVIASISQKAGYLPAIAGQAIGLAAGAVKAAREASAADPPATEGEQLGITDDDGTAA